MTSGSVEVASINTLEGDEQGKVFLTVNRALKVHGNSSVDSLHISGKPWFGPLSVIGPPPIHFCSGLPVMCGCWVTPAFAFYSSRP